MSYYTTAGKSFVCPRYNVRVTLCAKYRFTDNPSNPYEAKYVNATCPIVENARLPHYEQCNEYKYLLSCGNELECMQNIDFKPLIDTSKDGYSV